MAENKTSKNNGSVIEFIESIKSDTKRNDSYQIIEIMKDVTKSEPAMWGSSIIGFGDTRYTTADGKEHDSFNIGFSPRKQNITMYLLVSYEKYGKIMARLGKYKTGKVCLYINKLADVDVEVLKEIIQVAYEKSCEKN